jgi:hypothetical protein
LAANHPDWKQCVLLPSRARRGARFSVQDRLRAIAFSALVRRRCRSSWELALADILIQCPRTGAPVSTGLKTEWVFLKSLPCVAVPLRCPACGQMHKWKPDDAWIGSARQLDGANLLTASRASVLAAASGSGAKTPECD